MGEGEKPLPESSADLEFKRMLEIYYQALSHESPASSAQELMNQAEGLIEAGRKEEALYVMRVSGSVIADMEDTFYKETIYSMIKNRFEVLCEELYGRNKMNWPIFERKFSR